MQSKILLKRTLLMVTLGGFALSLGITFNFILEGPVRSGSAQLIENAAAFTKQEQANSGLPVRLKIPGINVDATVEYVGVTPDGAMDAPVGPRNVAWFDLGPRPGEEGSAVIAGHSGWKNGVPAVFDNLYKLRKGDKIYVQDEKGTIITFVVRESRLYNPEVSASDVFNSNDGRAHLNLVTCEGAWDKVSKTYSKRLVIFADKETD